MVVRVSDSVFLCGDNVAPLLEHVSFFKWLHFFRYALKLAEDIVAASSHPDDTLKEVQFYGASYMELLPQ